MPKFTMHKLVGTGKETSPSSVLERRVKEDSTTFCQNF
jgi:hypothetical protein